MKKNVHLQLFNTLLLFGRTDDRSSHANKFKREKTGYKLDSDVQKIPREIKLTFVTPSSHGSYMALIFLLSFVILL